MLLFALVAIVALAWAKPLDAIAETQVDAGLKRALTSFAVARVLNGIISVAQGTEIALTPGGIGANLTPGQILDPVNDLVEQFSELMLFASVAFGIMKVLLSIGSYWVLPAVLSAAVLTWGGFKFSGRVPPILLTKLLLVLIFVRFSVPLVAVGSDLLYQQFLDTKFKESQLVIENGQNQLLILSPPSSAASIVNNESATVMPVPAPSAAEVPPPPAPSKSLWERAKEVANQAKDTAVQAKNSVASLPHKIEQKIEQAQQHYDPRPYLEKLKNLAGQLVEHIITLIVVFVMQTIIIPLAFVWALYRACFTLLHSVGRNSEVTIRRDQ